MFVISTINLAAYTDALVVLGTAGILVPLLSRLGFSPVLGYLAAGAAALVFAFTATVFAQSGSEFLNNVDPLFSGVLTHPGNLDNTGH